MPAPPAASARRRGAPFPLELVHPAPQPWMVGIAQIKEVPGDAQRLAGDRQAGEVTEREAEAGPQGGGAEVVLADHPTVAFRLGLSGEDPPHPGTVGIAHHLAEQQLEMDFPRAHSPGTLATTWSRS